MYVHLPLFCFHRYFSHFKKFHFQKFPRTFHQWFLIGLTKSPCLVFLIKALYFPVFRFVVTLYLFLTWRQKTTQHSHVWNGVLKERWMRTVRSLPLWLWRYQIVYRFQFVHVCLYKSRQKFCVWWYLHFIWYLCTYLLYMCTVHSTFFTFWCFSFDESDALPLFISIRRLKKRIEANVKLGEDLENHCVQLKTVSWHHMTSWEP